MPYILLLSLLTSSLSAGVNSKAIADRYCKWYPDKCQSERLWYEFVGTETIRYAKSLGLKDSHIKILTVCWIVESDLDHRSVAIGEDSYGVTQVRVRWAKDHAKPLVSRDIMPEGSLADPTVQIALGVSSYAVMLKRSGGDAWEAVRRYNGKGKKAERHLKRVKRIYRKLWE